ncbi:MAG: KH domain-containing protein, partial [Gaiellales bacterium]
GAPVVVALNKVDLVTPPTIAEQIVAASSLGDLHALHPVSARTGDGVDALRLDLVALLPERAPLFPTDATSDLTTEEQIAELVREQALRLTREELPHATTAEVEEIERGAVRVIVIVETESQKRILVGKGGRMIREIGTRSRPGVERVLGRTVYLDLVVKVRRRWRADADLLSRLGI